jgi:hypothetical protein
MSATPQPPVPPVSSNAEANREIKLISHSSLFYWWPVWFFAGMFAIWTGIEGNRLAIIPDDGTVNVRQTATETSYELTYKTRKKYQADAETATVNAETTSKVFRARVSDKAWMGSIFVLILVLTMVITNVPMRGLWSFLVIVLIVVVALLITLFHAWDDIYELLGGLRIYINMAGYLFIAGAVFAVWALATWFFDRRNYIIFTPGQIKVCEHIGASVQTYDTVGMTFEKKRDDLFRHYILGFGSGDLVIRTAGASHQEILIHNVLGIGWKLKGVEDLIRERSTV